MRKTMEAILWDGSDYPGSLTLQEVPIPEPSPGWVLVNIKACGICGSDLHLIIGDTRYLVPQEHFPAILGHENGGIVAKAGEGVSSIQEGDRVAIEPLHPCTVYGETCPMCAQGKYHLCLPGLAFVGMPIGRFSIPGGYGEYALAHESRIFKLPENLSFEEAAILDTLAVEVHALEIGKPKLGDVVTVVGCGIIGLEMIQVLKARGICDIIGIAKYEYQAEFAQKLGASEIVVLGQGVDPVAEVKKLTGGIGVSQVYECVGGNTDAVAQSLSMCGRGGKVIMIGGASRPRPIDLQEMILLETSLKACMSYSHTGTTRDFQIAMDLLRDGLVDHKSLITHTFSPEEFEIAINTAVEKKSQRVIKVIFTRE